MIEIYQRHAMPHSATIKDQQRREDLVSGVKRTPTTTHRTRNPVIHMYVFPHRSKADGFWIPGYWTSFQLYERPESSDTWSED